MGGFAAAWGESVLLDLSVYQLIGIAAVAATLLFTLLSPTLLRRHLPLHVHEPQKFGSWDMHQYYCGCGLLSLAVVKRPTELVLFVQKARR